MIKFNGKEVKQIFYNQKIVKVVVFNGKTVHLTGENQNKNNNREKKQ